MKPNKLPKSRHYHIYSGDVTRRSRTTGSAARTPSCSVLAPSGRRRSSFLRFCCFLREECGFRTVWLQRNVYMKKETNRDVTHSSCATLAEKFNFLASIMKLFFNKSGLQDNGVGGEGGDGGETTRCDATGSLQCDVSSTNRFTLESFVASQLRPNPETTKPVHVAVFPQPLTGFQLEHFATG